MIAMRKIRSYGKRPAIYAVPKYKPEGYDDYIYRYTPGAGKYYAECYVRSDGQRLSDDDEIPTKIWKKDYRSREKFLGAVSGWVNHKELAPTFAILGDGEAVYFCPWPSSRSPVKRPWHADHIYDGDTAYFVSLTDDPDVPGDEIAEPVYVGLAPLPSDSNGPHYSEESLRATLNTSEFAPTEILTAHIDLEISNAEFSVVEAVMEAAGFSRMDIESARTKFRDGGYFYSYPAHITIRPSGAASKNRLEYRLPDGRILR